MSGYQHSLFYAKRGIKRAQTNASILNAKLIKNLCILAK